MKSPKRDRLEGEIIKRKLMEILACPIDKYHPLELYVFEEKEEIVEGLMSVQNV